jgi:uncharacterized membrane protein YfcA
MDFSAAEIALVGVAGFGAGIVNAIAGGGSLISFPALVAVGVPSVRANITNTVALCPGYLGGAFAQREELGKRQPGEAWLLVVSGIGGLTGAALLLGTSEKVFRALVPYLVLFASGLLAAQGPLKRRLNDRRARLGNEAPAGRLPLPLLGSVFCAAVYGGYFGAGLGIVLLAVLGLFIDRSLTAVNALKSALSLVVNVLAALFLVWSGEVVWLLALVMAVTSLGGGAVGGHLAGRIKPEVLRTIVVLFGVAVAISFFVK